VPAAYADARELAQDPDVDLVVVSVKVNEHDAPVRAVIEAGKAVF
jgi:predicted dehydrogenase